MLMLDSSAYGKLHPKGDILLSATIRQSRGKKWNDLKTDYIQLYLATRKDALLSILH